MLEQLRFQTLVLDDKGKHFVTRCFNNYSQIYTRTHKLFLLVCMPDEAVYALFELVAFSNISKQQMYVPLSQSWTTLARFQTSEGLSLT